MSTRVNTVIQPCLQVASDDLADVSPLGLRFGLRGFPQCVIDAHCADLRSLAHRLVFTSGAIFTAIAALATGMHDKPTRLAQARVVAGCAWMELESHEYENIGTLQFKAVFALQRIDLPALLIFRDAHYPPDAPWQCG